MRLVSVVTDMIGAKLVRVIAIFFLIYIIKEDGRSNANGYSYGNIGHRELRKCLLSGRGVFL